MMVRLFLVFALGFSALCTGCAKQQPVLYPNARLEQVGQEQANADIQACMKMAEEHGVKNAKGGEVARESAVGAAAGGIAAGAWAAVTGGNVGQNVAAGAAAGGTGSAVHGAANSGSPKVVYKSFVDKCLTDKGYQVLGWE